MASDAPFAIEYSRWFAALASALGTGPRLSRLDVGSSDVTVRMGWAFSARIPRSSIVGARRHPDIHTAIGVHTAGRGDWIVNGTTHDIVELRIAPPVRARAIGVPVRLRRLRLSVERPDELVATLAH